MHDCYLHEPTVGYVDIFNWDWIGWDCRYTTSPSDTVHQREPSDVFTAWLLLAYKTGHLIFANVLLKGNTNQYQNPENRCSGWYIRELIHSRDNFRVPSMKADLMASWFFIASIIRTIRCTHYGQHSCSPGFLISRSQNFFDRKPCTDCMNLHHIISFQLHVLHVIYESLSGNSRILVFSCCEVRLLESHDLVYKALWFHWLTFYLGFSVVELR